MVIDNLYILGARIRPAKADAELIVNTDAVLPRTIALERLQPVSRRHTKVLQLASEPQMSSMKKACNPVLPDSVSFYPEAL